jgi:hypothetical protein
MTNPAPDLRRELPDKAMFGMAEAAKGIETLSVVIERQEDCLALIPTTPRGAPAPKDMRPPRDLVHFSIPQIKLEDAIQVEEIQDVREFGKRNTLVPADLVIKRQMAKMANRLDFTLEHHRLGAVKGAITDADGAVLVDLYAAFGLLNELGMPEPEVVPFCLDDRRTEVRLRCQDVHRLIRGHAKMVLSDTARVWALCGDDFFDALISHRSVKDTYNGTASAARRPGAEYAYGIFEYGDIFFENYQGTGAVTIDPDEARFFLSGVPEIFGEWFSAYGSCVAGVLIQRYRAVAHRFSPQ